MLTDEEFKKLEKQYIEESDKREEIENLEEKIKDCKEIIKTFTTDNPWVSIYNVKITWTESESDIEGKRCIGSEDKRIEIDDPSIFAEGIKQMIKRYEEEIKKIKGENK